MELIPGDPEHRPAWVTACAPRTGAIREAERDVQLHSLVGVLLDARARLTCEQVHREVFHQLRIPGFAVAVSKLKDATFLLRFEQPAQRNAALGRRHLSVGNTSLHLMPWTRQFGVAATSKLKYRVRVCIEGVPAHAADIDTISKLFSAETVVDRIDTEKRREEERACVCVWITTLDPDAIAMEGTLKLEEPVEFSEEEYHEFMVQMGDPDMGLPEVRPGIATLLDYEVL
ncbi:hypothetical protein PVAP13_5NG014360, partial [Panicum virgatum]